MKDLASEVNLKFHLDSIYDSDYEPFEASGHVVIGAYDGSAKSEKKSTLSFILGPAEFYKLELFNCNY